MQGLRRALFALLAVLFVALLPQAVVHAQSSGQAAEEAAPPVKIDRRKLLVQPKNADGSITQASFFEDPVLWIQDKQRAFYGKMSSALRALRGGSAREAAWTLMLLSFGYGVFHAAGPGHGKAIISSYVMADGRTLRTGVALSFLAAAVQGAAALAVVGAVILIVGAGARQVDATVAVVESASYALILLLGLWLSWRKGAALLAAWRGGPGDAHGAGESCDHCHLPPAEVLAGGGGRGFFGAALAAGMRPCSGAIIVLVFAIAQGMFLAGAAAVLAMAFGTALITSLIAGLAVGFKQTAVMLASGRASTRLLPRLLEFAAALAVAALGAALLTGYLAGSG